VSSADAESPAAAEQARLRRRGIRLEYATIGWNVAEAAIAIGLGVAAGSIALVAFGLDSVIEVFASGVVVWHERHPDVPEERTRRALRLIGAAFFALGVFLVIAAAARLAAGATPDESPLGIAYLALTVVVMFALARLKHATGEALQSRPLLAEAHVSYLDSALAAGVLSSLVLFAAWEWWWADPLAAIAVAVFAFVEGREAWSGEVV
jgi:divalent metal cation (Fe/Co/Zn/Cd) transporter